MVLGGEERLECKVCVDGIHLEHVLKFKYLRYVLDKSGRNEAECSRKMASGRRIAGAIRFLVDARNLQLEWARLLHESLLLHVLRYDSEVMVWREKEDMSRIRAVQMDNLRGLIGTRKMDKILNA